MTNPYLAENCAESVTVPTTLWTELVCQYKLGDVRGKSLSYLFAAINEVDGYPACKTCQETESTHEEEQICDGCYNDMKEQQEEER